MALSKKSKARIMKLVEFMNALPKSANDHFYMGHWFIHKGHHSLGEYVDAETLKDCGTTACALGWACTIPSFKRAGLKMPVFNQPHSAMIEMGSKFFGLEVDQTHALFGFGTVGEEVGTAHAATPKKWARLACKLVKQWEASTAR